MDDQPKMRDLAAMHTLTTLMFNSFLSERSRLAAALDPSRGRALTVDAECKYPETLTLFDYHYIYDRMGVAQRCVSLYPEECWVDDPDVYEDATAEQTQWESELADLVDAHHLWSILEEADTKSGIGCFAVVLIGLDDGKELHEPVDNYDATKGILNQPSAAARSILFLRVFAEGDGLLPSASKWQTGGAKIKELNTNKNSPRFGMPEVYTIVIDGVSHDVHWTRCLHISEGPKSRLHAIFNDLLDLKKISGGSSEMFWRGAFPGLSFEVDPQFLAAGATLDIDTLRDEFTKYSEGLQRYLAVTGVNVKSLAPQAVDPTPHTSNVMRRLSIAMRCPKRVLEGSEQGQLASDQDTKGWNKRIGRRRERYCSARIIRPSLEHFTLLGVMSEPKEVMVDWSDLNASTDKEQADVAKTVTEALKDFATGNIESIIEPRFYFTHILHWEQELVDEAVKYLEQVANDMANTLGDTQPMVGQQPPNGMDPTTTTTPSVTTTTLLTTTDKPTTTTPRPRKKA